jgi:hypothetical protein
MNLRLGSEAETALRAHARLTGRSQQAILREALDRYLAVAATAEPAPTGTTEPAPTSDRERLIAAGVVLPPRTPYRRTMPTLSLPDGMTTLDLLDRDDRL